MLYIEIQHLQGGVIIKKLKKITAHDFLVLLKNSGTEILKGEDYRITINTGNRNDLNYSELTEVTTL